MNQHFEPAVTIKEEPITPGLEMIVHYPMNGLYPPSSASHTIKPEVMKQTDNLHGGSLVVKKEPIESGENILLIDDPMDDPAASCTSSAPKTKLTEVKDAVKTYTSHGDCATLKIKNELIIEDEPITSNQKLMREDSQNDQATPRFSLALQTNMLEEKNETEIINDRTTQLQVSSEETNLDMESKGDRNGMKPVLAFRKVYNQMEKLEAKIPLGDQKLIAGTSETNLLVLLEDIMVALNVCRTSSSAMIRNEACQIGLAHATKLAPQLAVLEREADETRLLLGQLQVEWELTTEAQERLIMLKKEIAELTHKRKLEVGHNVTVDGGECALFENNQKKLKKRVAERR